MPDYVWKTELIFDVVCYVSCTEDSCIIQIENKLIKLQIVQKVIIEPSGSIWQKSIPC